MDKTGENYIIYDHQLKQLYKISRKNFDSGNRNLKHRFDIENNPMNINPTKHIDWDMVRSNPYGATKFIGKTNKEAALNGFPPISSNGRKLQLHHVGQNAKGPLVEVGEVAHKKGHKTLHQQHGVNKGHPEFPVNHGSKWQSDMKNYWKERAKNVK